MLDFDLTEEQIELRATVRRLAGEQYAPRAQGWDEARTPSPR